MLLVPKHELGNKLKHVRLSAATVSSTSLAAPGTGLVFIPVYAFCTASAVGSVRYLNGTGGSALFEFKMQAGGNVEIHFWEEPNAMSANKAAVLESETNNIGVHDFHVWLMTVRGGAGGDGLGQ